MIADYVRCSNCDEVMYVVVGTEVCPKCKHRGVLAWADHENEDNHEVNVDVGEITNWEDQKNVYNETETFI